MVIRIDNVGIAVRDLDEAVSFFTDLGLTVLGRDTVSGEWADIAVGLDGDHAKIAMLQTPNGQARLELFEYIHPEAIETEPTRPNEIGMHRVAFRRRRSRRGARDRGDARLSPAARCRPVRGPLQAHLPPRSQWDPRDARSGVEEGLIAGPQRGDVVTRWMNARRAVSNSRGLSR